MFKGIRTYQRLASCELKDNGEPVPEMIVWDAYLGSTVNEMRWYNDTFEYTSDMLILDPEESTRLFVNFYYPLCIKLLKGYIEKRRNQINRKSK